MRKSWLGASIASIVGLAICTGCHESSRPSQAPTPAPVQAQAARARPHRRQAPGPALPVPSSIPALTPPPGRPPRAAVLYLNSWPANGGTLWAPMESNFWIFTVGGQLWLGTDANYQAYPTTQTGSGQYIVNAGPAAGWTVSFIATPAYLTGPFAD